MRLQRVVGLEQPRRTACVQLAHRVARVARLAQLALEQLDLRERRLEVGGRRPLDPLRDEGARLELVAWLGLGLGLGSG